MENNKEAEISLFGKMRIEFSKLTFELRSEVQEKSTKVLLGSTFSREIILYYEAS